MILIDPKMKVLNGVKLPDENCTICIPCAARRHIHDGPVGRSSGDKITIKIPIEAMTLEDFLHFGKGRTFQTPSHPRLVGRVLSEFYFCQVF